MLNKLINVKLKTCISSPTHQL